MTLTTSQIELMPWYVIAVYWAITWLRVKRTKAGEKSADRMITLAVVVLAFNLIVRELTENRATTAALRSAERVDRVVGHRIDRAGGGARDLGALRDRTVLECPRRPQRRTPTDPLRAVCGGAASDVHRTVRGSGGNCFGGGGVAWSFGGCSIACSPLPQSPARRIVLLTSEFGEEYRNYRRSTGFLFPRLSGGAGMDTPTERP